MTASQRYHFEDFHRVWFLTWTTYATWLPGDPRGFVSPKFDRSPTEPRNNVPDTPYDSGRPDLQELAASKVQGAPIFLKQEQADAVKQQLTETACHRHWQICVGAILSNHLHLLVGVMDDPDPSILLRDFKSYASRCLNRLSGKPASGTWWTEQGSKRKIKDARHFENVRSYILRQPNPLVVWESERTVPRSLGRNA